LSRRDAVHSLGIARYRKPLWLQEETFGDNVAAHSIEFCPCDLNRARSILDVGRGSSPPPWETCSFAVDEEVHGGSL
jgi:hypothetical protein